MMQYKCSSYGKGNATDTETTKIAKETDTFHLILLGVQVTINIAKGLEYYFSLLHLHSCKKLEGGPNILTHFQSHIVGFLCFFLQNPNNYLRTSPGRLIGISISNMASKKTKGLRLVYLHFQKSQSKNIP